MSGYDTQLVRKRIGLGLDNCCHCSEASRCCGELPDALDELERLTAEVSRKDAFIGAVMDLHEDGNNDEIDRDIGVMDALERYRETVSTQQER